MTEPFLQDPDVVLYHGDVLERLLRPLAPGPWRCCICGRYCAAREENLSHEWGDYGSILSTEVICPRCPGDRPAARD